MKCLSSILGLTTLALLSTLGLAAPADRSDAPAPTNAPDPEKGNCKPEYNITRYSLDIEDIGPQCYFVCPEVTIYNITTSRGAGKAYRRETMQKPLLIPNISGWKAVNCTWAALSNMEERYACANNSVKALYSPGKSPWDPKLKPRLNTLDFPETYIMGALESFYVTPLRLPNGTRSAKLEVTGTKLDGTTVKVDIDLDISSGKKQFLVSGLVAKGLTYIKTFDFWLIAGGKGGYEFALDNLVLDEYRPKPLPPHCTPPPTSTTVDKGPCTQKPSRTTTWTADAEDLTPTASVTSPYQSVNWYNYVTAQDKDNLTPYIMVPPQVITSSGKNVFQAGSPFHLFAVTHEERFGVSSLEIACSFPYSIPDYSERNGKPCNLYFVGRRDPYDGDGLPFKVTANFTIENTNKNGTATSQKMVKIDLDKLTNSPGKFSRLYAFTVYATQTTTSGYVFDDNIVLDNIVLYRATTPDDPKCRMPGGKTLDFDDIKVGDTPTQVGIYNGFKFGGGWQVIRKKDYKPGTAGYKAVISDPNAAWNGWVAPPNEYVTYEIDSYVDPNNNFLFDFEELTLTLDVPLASNSSVNDIQITISVLDACGAGSYYPYTDPIKNPAFYWRQIRPTKFQFVYAEPIKAISRMNIYASYTSGDYGQVNIFIDDFKYRKHKGPTPGCQACGTRGGDSCEVPMILGR